MKALVLDLDGTLLNANKKVTKRNIDAVEQVMERDIPVIIATARPPRTVRKLLPNVLQERSSMIYYNGALIESEGKQKHTAIEPVLVQQVCEYVRRNEKSCWISMEVNDRWVCIEANDYRSLIGVSQNPEQIDLEVFETLSPTKMLLCHIQNPQALSKAFSSIVNVLHTDKGTLTQLMNHAATKEAAVSEITAIKGISLTEVVVFGDDYNDLGLFQHCGYPVAMGNAIPELKAIASEVTSSNNDDGVAVTLERILKTMER